MHCARWVTGCSARWKPTRLRRVARDAQALAHHGHRHRDAHSRRHAHHGDDAAHASGADAGRRINDEWTTSAGALCGRRGGKNRGGPRTRHGVKATAGCEVRSPDRKLRGTSVPYLDNNVPSFCKTSDIVLDGNVQISSAFLARQSRLLTWSDRMAPVTGRPAGRRTSNG